MFKDLKLRPALIISFLIPVTGALLMGVVGQFQIAAVGDLLTKLYRHPYTVSNAVLGLKSNLFQEKGMLLEYKGNDVAIGSRFKELREQNVAIFGALKERFLGDLSKIKNLEQSYLAVTSKTDQISNGKEVTSEHISEYAGLEKGLQSISSFAANKGEIFYTKANEKRAGVVRTNLMILCLIILVSSILFVWVYRLLYARFDSLREEIFDSAMNICVFSKELVETGEKLSSTNAGLGKHLVSSSEVVHQIDKLSHSNQDLAQGSNSAAQESVKFCEEGFDTVNKLKTSIAGIQQGNEKLATEFDTVQHDFEEIITAISEIGDKTKVIDEIVFQTKLLSFNASVEAARAGEHGKGFAVVAEEVGNLASMSGNAAQDISDMLDAGIKRVEDTVSTIQSKVRELVDKSTHEVNAGVQVAEQTSQSFGNIQGQVQEMAHKSGQVAQASSEQRQGMERISSALLALKESNQDGIKLSEDSKKVGEKLAIHSGRLDQAVFSLSSFLGHEIDMDAIAQEGVTSTDDSHDDLDLAA